MHVLNNHLENNNQVLHIFVTCTVYAKDLIDTLNCVAFKCKTFRLTVSIWKHSHYL